METDKTLVMTDLNEFNTPNVKQVKHKPLEYALPHIVSCLSPRAQDIHSRLKAFCDKWIAPFEHSEYRKWLADPKTRWVIHPKVEQLKEKANSEGLWNLFISKQDDPEGKYGQGLTHVEYAFIAEETGRSDLAPEIFNCMAPDSGNMHILAKYGTEKQKSQWLQPLLDGSIRSCLAITEEEVASSDPTNITSSVRKEGDHYVINGRKWLISGIRHPYCQLCVFMGKTSDSTKVPSSQRHSMILIPMDSPGVTITQTLTHFGHEYAPYGFGEISFDNARVPLDQIMLTEGEGFQIAQEFLGPSRIHYCERLIGMAEVTLEETVERVKKRKPFGKPLSAHTSVQQQIANARIAIEGSRLLVLKAAHMMDIMGTRMATTYISMAKVVVPKMTQNILDMAIQAHGGAGVAGVLSEHFATARSMRMTAGPDEVHQHIVARAELNKPHLKHKL